MNTIKIFPVKLGVLGHKVYDQLVQIFNYDETISELWNSDFSYRERNCGEETEWEVFLTDTILFRFNKIEL